MKQKSQGFIISLLVGIIALLAVGVGVYFYVNKNTNLQAPNSPDIVSNENATSTKSDLVKINKQTTPTDNFLNTKTQAGEFPLPTTPTILQTNCRMDVCTWKKISKIETIKNDTYGELRKITVSEIGSSTHRPDEGYPLEYNQNIPIKWETNNPNEYLLCSKENPFYIYKADEDNTYTAMKLNIEDPYGFEISAVSNYLFGCHGLNQWNPKQVALLGYKNTREIVEIKIDSVEEIFNHLK